MRFICEQHKQQAIHCPTTALSLWKSAFKNGVNASEAGSWQQAWCCFGTALDIAILIYEHSCVPRETAKQIEYVKCSYQNLAICLYQLNRSAEADSYLLELHNWLKQAASPQIHNQPAHTRQLH